MNAHIAEPQTLDMTAEKPETAPAAAPEAEEEEDLILHFKKPYSFEGKRYTEVDLSGLADISAADLCKVNKMAKKDNGVDPIPEMSLSYAIYMAVRITNLPVEFFQRLPAQEAIKLKNLVTGFLYGGVSDK